MTDLPAFMAAWPGNEARIDTYQRLLRLFPPGRLIDLGAGPSPFGSLAADAGWTVTAVDARPDLRPDDARITWVQQDVRQTPLDGFDLIVCLGLLYHLTVQDQLDLLARAAPAPMILDTHLAAAEESMHAGYPGRVYPEPGQGGRVDPLGSWGNTHSFWPTPASLRRMATDSGYRLVLTVDPWVRGDRAFFVCL